MVRISMCQSWVAVSFLTLAMLTSCIIFEKKNPSLMCQEKAKVQRGCSYLLNMWEVFVRFCFWQLQLRWKEICITKTKKFRRARGYGAQVTSFCTEYFQVLSWTHNDAANVNNTIRLRMKHHWLIVIVVFVNRTCSPKVRKSRTMKRWKTERFV